VSGLAEGASAAGVPLRLRVLLVNPARHLYRRLGLTMVERPDKHEYYETAPTRRDGDEETRTP